MEGFPFRLSLSLIIAGVVVGLSFYMLNIFVRQAEEKKFADDINTLRQTFDTLASTGDYGSFRDVQITVPAGSSITVPARYRNFTVNFFGALVNYSIAGEFLWSNSYTPGSYKLTLVKTQNPYYRENISRPNDNLVIGFQ